MTYTVLYSSLATIAQTFLKKSSVITKLLLTIGVIFIIIPTFFYINEFVQLSVFTPKIPVVTTTKAATHLNLPVEIQIPTVHMDLPIRETTITHNTWQIADAGVSHLALSSRPGEHGPIILYSHNTNDRFGPIRWLREGQAIQLLTDDKTVHTYTIIKTTDIDPTKTAIFFSEKGETLFLYTCDGFADLQRFVIIAKPL